MPSYIVFQNTVFGFKRVPEFDSGCLMSAVKCVTEASKYHYYFIYKRHCPDTVPLFGTHFDLYQFEKAVGGSSVPDDMSRITEGHHFALTHRNAKTWLFTDDLFGEEDDE